MADFFVNCDWGTSRFRLRLASLDGGTIVAEHCSQLGVGRLAEDSTADARPARFAAALAGGLVALGQQQAELRGATVAISGMASSSIGWLELPYASLPWRLDGSAAVWRELTAEETGLPQRTVLISGVRAASDVLRGEETEALGLFQLPLGAPLAERSIVVFPGTHSKHLRIVDGAMVDFQTFMTGELFEVLARHSLLRYSVGPEAGENSPRAEESPSFVEGVRLAGELPLAAALFRVRTRQVLDGRTAEENRALLSGVLIGAELAYLAAAADRGTPVVLAAATGLSAPYEAAVSALGLAPRTVVIPPDDVARLSALGQALLLRHIGNRPL
jgi:2-dehydro-3-deoxygalactonokinase